MDTSSAQNRISAAPPSVVNTGAPITVANSKTPKAGHFNLAGDTGNQPAAATNAAINNTATRRPRQLVAACHHNRAAITPKPTGNSSCTYQVLMPYAMT